MFWVTSKELESVLVLLIYTCDQDRMIWWKDKIEIWYEQILCEDEKENKEKKRTMNEVFEDSSNYPCEKRPSFC